MIRYAALTLAGLLIGLGGINIIVDRDIGMPRAWPALMVIGGLLLLVIAL